MAPDSFKSVDISMSKEEMLEDLYKEYEAAISDCEDELEYIYLLSSFVKNYPSGHTAIPEQSPEYLRTIYFELSGECGLSKDEDDYLNAYEKKYGTIL